MSILARPTPSYAPLMISMILMSSVFLYSSRCTIPFALMASAWDSDGAVVFLRFSGLSPTVKNLISVIPSSDLPDPFGPKRFRSGKLVVYDVITSLNMDARR